MCNNSCDCCKLNKKGLINVECRECKILFNRVSRSKLCGECKIILKKKKKNIRNKLYYKMKKEKKVTTK